MDRLCGLSPKAVFGYFEKISAMPRGSGYTDKIANFCVDFAETQELRYVRDGANNVVIFKDATPGYEKAEPMILQGHLDMVWQKDEDSKIDFYEDGLDIGEDGEFVFAKGTTLGADNGIAVAMIMAILASNDIAHPALEAVFTTDEEIGMIGAKALDIGILSGKRMINLDSEDPAVLTVSCAGGSDFTMEIPLKRQTVCGERVTLTLSGLRGGHSGIEINGNRVNANILAARVLNHVKKSCDFDIISIFGGTKANAIPNHFVLEAVTGNAEVLVNAFCEYLQVIKEEISDREPDFEFEVKVDGKGEFFAIKTPDADSIIRTLLLAPNGVCEMSANIENLVETSLNMGILNTEEDVITICFALRSNKALALFALEEKMHAFSKIVPCKVATGGHYMPWEYMPDSAMQKLCIETYMELYGYEPTVEAIHAGLECATFSESIKGLDCIAIGPKILDAHTTKERLDIASVGKIFDLVLEMLKKCK